MGLRVGRGSWGGGGDGTRFARIEVAIVLASSTGMEFEIAWTFSRSIAEPRGVGGGVGVAGFAVFELFICYAYFIAGYSIL